MPRHGKAGPTARNVAQPLGSLNKRTQFFLTLLNQQLFLNSRYEYLALLRPVGGTVGFYGKNLAKCLLRQFAGLLRENGKVTALGSSPREAITLYTLQPQYFLSLISWEPAHICRSDELGYLIGFEEGKLWVMGSEHFESEGAKRFTFGN